MLVFVLQQLQKLKAENERLRAENRALTRVVSKLTHSAAKQVNVFRHLAADHAAPLHSYTTLLTNSLINSLNILNRHTYYIAYHCMVLLTKNKQRDSYIKVFNYFLSIYNINVSLFQLIFSIIIMSALVRLGHLDSIVIH